MRAPLSILLVLTNSVALAGPQFTVRVLDAKWKHLVSGAQIEARVIEKLPNGSRAKDVPDYQWDCKNGICRTDRIGEDAVQLQLFVSAPEYPKKSFEYCFTDIQKGEVVVELKSQVYARSDPYEQVFVARPCLVYCYPVLPNPCMLGCWNPCFECSVCYQTPVCATYPAMPCVPCSSGAINSSRVRQVRRSAATRLRTATHPTASTRIPISTNEFRANSEPIRFSVSPEALDRRVW